MKGERPFPPSGKPELTKGMRPPRLLRRLTPLFGAAQPELTCFPILPETMSSDWRRRGCGCAGRGPRTPRSIHRFCSLWEVARYTARIPHPYPPGSAERFIYAAREGNASGRDLTLVMTPKKGKLDAIGSISLELRGGDRLTLGFVLAPEHWGKGLTTEATRAMVKTGFGLTDAVEILANVRVENDSSRHVLETCGFDDRLDGPEGRAGARRARRMPHLPPDPRRLDGLGRLAAAGARPGRFDQAHLHSGRPA